jgi:hypothetical protein
MQRRSKGRLGTRSHTNLRLTLVTCYPCYFVGSAPRRFIVRPASTAQTSPAQKRPALNRIFPGKLRLRHRLDAADEPIAEMGMRFADGV